MRRKNNSVGNISNLVNPFQLAVEFAQKIPGHSFDSHPLGKASCNQISTYHELIGHGKYCIRNRALNLAGKH